MATTKLYKWLLPMMILISAFSYAQPSHRDIWNNDIFKKRNQGPVTERDGTIRYPDGSVRYPDGTISYPDGSVRYPNGRVERNGRYPDSDRRFEGQHQCCNGCGMPPGQAKKKYGGHAKDYAKNKKNCNHKGNRNWDDDDDDRRVRTNPKSYPSYPYPPAPQNPRNGQKYPSGKNRSL
jgi:hypothetical protein